MGKLNLNEQMSCEVTSKLSHFPLLISASLLCWEHHSILNLHSNLMYIKQELFHWVVENKSLGEIHLCNSAIGYN